MASLLSSLASPVASLSTEDQDFIGYPHTGVIVNGTTTLTPPVHAAGLGWEPDNCYALTADSVTAGATFHIRKDPAGVPANTFLPQGDDDIVAVVWEFDGDADDSFYETNAGFAVGDAGAFGTNGAQTGNNFRVRQKRRIEVMTLRVDEDFTTVSSPGPTYTGVLNRVDARLQFGAGWLTGALDGIRYLGAYSDWQRNKCVMAHILDDGYADQYDYWWPLFRDRNLPFTFALNSSNYDTNITHAQYMEMKNSGLVDFVSHGETHADLTLETQQGMQDIIDNGYSGLQATGLMDHNAKIHVFTGGNYGQRELDYLNLQGYHMAFSTRSDAEGGNNEFDFLGLGGVPLNPMEMMRGLHFSETNGETTAAECLALVDRAIDVGSTFLCGYAHAFPVVPVASTDFARGELEDYADGIESRRDAGQIDLYKISEVASITQDFGLFSGGLNAMRRRRR